MRTRSPATDSHAPAAWGACDSPTSTLPARTVATAATCLCLRAS